MQKFFLKDYQTPPYEITHVSLFFDLHETHTLVKSSLKLNQLKQEPLVLDGKELELVSVKLNGKDFDKFRKTETQLTIDSTELSSQFELEIITKLKPHENTALEGLYKTNGYYVTQCEAQSFRRITYYMDRPDVMSRFDVVIEADQQKYPVLLSNGDRIATKSLPNGRHQVSWRDPHKKPSYLFAMVAGDLGVIRDSFTTMTGKKVNLEIYAAHGKQELCHHAMASLKHAMKWDEERYGREYDLNDYMIVAADDFNAGAMENKGLNIFNSRLVLANTETATDADFDAIESVVGHEYFHNWTGNRITCRDWFQLSLKEGLTVFRDQEFSADLGSRVVKRIDDVQGLRSRQFAEDAGPNAHPVRPTEAYAIDNFYTSTIYEKGAEVIRMMQTIVGRPGFRKGMDLYFKRHDGQAVTTDDFAAAIAEANNQDWSQFKLWYSQAGTPTVTLHEDYSPDAQTYTLTISQTCRSTKETEVKKPFHIPLEFALLDDSGNEMSVNETFVVRNTEEKSLLHLKQEKEVFTFKNIKTKPHLSILRNFSAPVNLSWNTTSENLLFLLENDSDLFNKWECTQKLYMQYFNQVLSAPSGEVPAAPTKFYSTLAKLIRDESLEHGFRAKLLEFPQLDVIMQSYSTFKMSTLKRAEKYLIEGFVLSEKETLKSVYQSLTTKLSTLANEGYSAKIIGIRRLKNLCLQILTATEESSSLELAFSQFQESTRMTDQVAALMALADHTSQLRDQAISGFYNKWQNESLILNKWFGLQARSRAEDTFTKVKQLTEHPKFNIQNPNNVYSLIRTLGYNVGVFYDSPKEVFDFYSDMVIKIDKLNPQVAARLCSAFDYWSKADEPQRGWMKEAREKIAKTPGISPNTYELISR